VVTVEIVLLAMVALFVDLRLYSVLGRRTGHEQQPILRPAETVRAPEPAAPVAETVAERPETTGFAYEDGAASGIRAIISADHDFDVARFLEGAQAAYRMILEAFWSGDRTALRPLVGDDVMESFEEAIADREEAGHRLDNRLIGIERASIEDAQLQGRNASITVRFDADIAAVTRDANGDVVAGSLTDAVPTHDLWTFRRNLSSSDPNWLLVETDEAA
jgi:predicted lipid-binding transport protein (Tim44 family)